MALKNLFDMVKADRYTADGREAIIKAQEAETEDATRRTYQIGEISQATGLQKTANGWVKPKNGKQPGAATKRDTDPQTYIVKKNDELRSMFQKEKDPAKKAAMKKALQKQASMMESESFAPGEEPGPDRDDSPEREAYERELLRQQAQRAEDDPRGFGYEEPPMEPAAGPSDEEVEIFKDIIREFKKNPNKKNEQIMNEAKSHLMKNRGMTPEQLGKIGRDVYAEKTKDAAPRVLTGDTRIKVRK